MHIHLYIHIYIHTHISTYNFFEEYIAWWAYLACWHVEAIQRPALSAPQVQDNLAGFLVRMRKHGCHCLTAQKCSRTAWRSRHAQPFVESLEVAMLIRKFALATNSTLLMELSQEQLNKEVLQSLLQKLETESPDTGDAQDTELRKMCEAYQQEILGGTYKSTGQIERPEREKSCVSSVSRARRRLRTSGPQGNDATPPCTMIALLLACVAAWLSHVCARAVLLMRGSYY